MQRQRHGRRIALSAERVHELLASAPLCRVATSSAAGPHVSPMWFVWDGRALWLYSLVASRRWRHVAAGSRLAVVVDGGDRFETYWGAELEGEAAVVGEVPRTGRPVPELVEVERAFARKYNGMDELVLDGRHAWLRHVPATVVSWDFGELASLRRRQAAGEG